MELPSTGSLSFGSLAGVKNSINLFKNDIDKTTNVTSLFSLSGVSTYMQENSATKNITLPNMLYGPSYSLSEFRGASHKGKLIQTINFSATVDGYDNLLIYANTGIIDLDYVQWIPTTNAKIKFSSKYEDGSIMWPETVYNLSYSGISSPVSILKTSNITLTKIIGRGSVTIAQSPNFSNNYVTIIYIRDTPREAGNYNFTITLTEE